MKKFYPVKKLACLLMLILAHFGIKAQTLSVTYNNPGNNGLPANTFTVPAGVTQITVEAWGAGGGGGGANGNPAGGGGGAGGGYVRAVNYPVIAGNTYTIFVGASGTGTFVIVGNGGESYFINNTTIKAVGGNGGGIATVNSTSAAGGLAVITGNIGFTVPFSYYGGAGGTGALGATAGGGGGSAGNASNGNAGGLTTGGAAVAGGAAGGNGGNGSIGFQGGAPGAGGGGGRASNNTDRLGGIGGAGQVIITYGIPEVDIRGNTISITDGDATPSLADWTDLGSSPLTIGLTRTFTIINTSTTAPLILGGITIAGTNASDFVVTALPNSTIAALSSTTFDITFRPSGTLTRSATFSIVTNDSDENPYNFSIQGTGTTPEIDVRGNTVSVVDGDITPTTADWTDFGSSSVGSTFTRVFTVHNTSATIPLTLGAISISGTGSADFSVTAAPSTTVAPSSNTSFTVQFAPSAAGLRSATISIVNNDSNENPYDFAVQGTGTEQEINLQGNTVSIVDGDVTPTTADWTDFGSTDVITGLNLTRAFTIQNSGTLPLTVGAISFSGAGAADYSVTTSPSSPIAAGGSTTFIVTFNPSVAGLRSATISIINNDGDENPYDFAIQGTGTEQEMNVQGNAVTIVDGDATPTIADWTDFGSTTVTLNSTRTFTIQNTGTTALTVGTITISGTNASEFVLTTLPAGTLAPGASTTFVVTFSPLATGVRTAAISIVNNDADENPYNFAFQGTGAATTCEIDVKGNLISIVDGDITPFSSDSTHFGETTVGTTISRVYTISNSGTDILYIGAITLSGTNTADFVVTSAPATSVAVNGATTIEITFTPGAIGARTATLSFANSDSNENVYDFAMQGTGQTALTFGPGGVRNSLQLWLRSDLLNGTTGVADGTAITTWNTQARGTDAVKPAAVGAPIYRNNPIHNVNFNAVVDFTNNYTTATQVYTDNDPTRQYLKASTGFYSQDMFVMLIPDVPMTSALFSNDIFCGDRNLSVQETDATGIGYAAYTSRMFGEVLTYAVGTSSGVGLGYGVADLSSNTYSTAGIINASNNGTLTGSNLTFNANDSINHTTDATQFANTTNSQYWIGRSEGWDGSLDGRVGEIITLNKRATDIERSNIQSYLAVKYGITLGVNGTSINYTNSDGNTIWDATANSGFNFDIAGIGKDDISRLNQKQSKSINPTEVMTIGLTDIYTTNTANTNTFATNKSYLVWGANGGTMVDSNVNLNIDLGPITITTITEVVNRKWKLVETGGDVATVRVAIPTASFISGLPALGATDAYVMVVATNAAFTTGVETVFMTTIGANHTCLYDFDGTKFISFGVAHQAVNPLHITLDGGDDFVKIDNVNEISNAFTIMTWIRPNGANTLGSERTILAKKPTAGTGYQLVLQTDNKVRMEWSVAGTTYSSITNTAIPNSKWRNIAVTYGSNILNIYIDGVLDKTATITTAPVSTNANFSMGGQYVDKLTINNLFKGDIDELRMWDKVLLLDEMRFIMNQEILQNTLGTKGVIMPTTVTKNDISTLLWNNLYAYYSMNSYIGTHLDDDSKNTNRGSLVIPDKISISIQTAPIPYESAVNGLWATNATWANGPIQDVPYSLSIVDGVTPIAWNIVKTTHNVDSTGNKVILGLFVNSNTLSASNDSKMEVSHYLKLDGKIDLVDKSQLIQTLNSDLDPTSAGSIERDQQGHKNIFNYNYWASPVGTINNTTNNNAYTVAGVMKDGTTTTPQNITWTGSYNGSPTSPITLSSFWIYKFQNTNPAYANWAAVGSGGSLNVAQGFTLKGSGATTTDQNYTFVGKPNNGIITTTVGANNLNLSGNPYASSLDSDAFIDANIASTTGTLYFWEHFSTNNSHNLLAYQGGYALRTKVGGTPAVTFPGLSGLGSSTKDPRRYIPVSQGFFIVGSAAGGTVTFNNNQRAFVKENNVLSSTLFRQNASFQNIPSTNHFMNNTEDSQGESVNYKKVRLGFTDRNGYHRQALIGFMNEHATSGIDAGYDGVHLDSQPNDMYFMNGTAKLNISGEGFFNVDNIYPVGVKTDAAGTVTFKVDEGQNFEDTFEAFIYDNQTNIYHNIRFTEFSIALPQGTIHDRFSLRFKNANALNTDNFSLNDGILIAYTNANNMLTIKNNLVDVTVEKVFLFNLLGQEVSNWKVADQDQQNIQLQIKNLSTGTYIVKIKTDKGETSKKIIIN